MNLKKKQTIKLTNNKMLAFISKCYVYEKLETMCYWGQKGKQTKLLDFLLFRHFEHTICTV